MRILVVGGNSGIGKVCVESLMAYGENWEGVLTVEVSVPSVAELDVTQEDSIWDYMAQHQDRPFHHLIYSAGINHLDWSQNMSVRKMAHVYDVNALGLMRMMHYEWRRIVVIGSDAADRPMRTSAAYNASKAALHAAVRCIARERASDQCQINVVAPGKIDGTAMTEYVEEATLSLRGWSRGYLQDYETGAIPMGRYGRKGEVAEVVRWLITEAPPYLNGAVIPVNGGR